MTPAERLQQMLRGFDVTQLIYVVAKLGVADHLEDGPRSSGELARAVGADPRALYRVLRAVASIGILARRGRDRFELAPLGELLRTGPPNSMRDSAIMWGEEWSWRAWGALLHSVQTGSTAFEHVAGMGLFEYLERNRGGAAEIFNNAMTRGSEAMVDEIVDAYDFSGIAKIVDVGGGHGAFLAGLLKANPQISGVLFDVPSVIEGAGDRIAAAGVADRCELVGGSFFESVPQGGDAYILKWIIHDWEDSKAVAILRNCRSAITEHGRLLLVERLLPAADEPYSQLRGDITMMVLPGGMERTEAEFRALLESAGFRLSEVIESPSELNVLVGTPI